MSDTGRLPLCPMCGRSDRVEAVRSTERTRDGRQAAKIAPPPVDLAGLIRDVPGLQLLPTRLIPSNRPEGRGAGSHEAPGPRGELGQTPGRRDAEGLRCPAAGES